MYFNISSILRKKFLKTKKTLASTSALSILCFSFALPAHADTKIVLGTSWFAQAEQGGFYQALATGIYKKYGLDVTIKMGGPQVNGIQLLAGGVITIATGYDFQTLKAEEEGVPVVTIAAFMQKDPQAILAHPDVNSLAALKGHPIYLASSSQTSFWPWVKERYGLTDAQLKPYMFSVVPFLHDPTSAQQGYVTSEPFAMEKAGVKPSILLLADYGYPPYSATLVVLQKTIQQEPMALQRFVEATSEGWKSYLADPAPGNALIKQANPSMSDAQLAFSLEQMKKYDIITGGEAQAKGIGVMTNARWEETDKVMVETGLLPASFDYHKAYTLKFMKGLTLPENSSGN